MNMQEKQEGVVTAQSKPKRVTQKTLNSVLFYNDAIIRPIKPTNNVRIVHGYIGEIIKLPHGSSSYQYSDGEEWKKALKNEMGFKIGDRVMYSFKLNIMLDGELLHLVGHIFGKICTTESIS
jgi:hypothetical protein